jgi:hypothetical protein
MIAKQNMKNVKSGGIVLQRTDMAAAQTMEDIEAAGDVRQLSELAKANYSVIASELRKLHTEIGKSHPEALIELERLQAAEQAARGGNGEATMSCLGNLGKWVGDFASKIGVSVVAKLIEKQAGL